jgi:5-methylcytosine-specific restriction protein A
VSRRSVPEWIGRTPDSAIPPRVRMRVFDRVYGFCQGPCGRFLGDGKASHADHVVALINGGENRESNLQLLCDWCHKDKTARDVAEKSETYEKRKRHLGIKKRGRTIPGRKFDGTPIPSRWRA